MTEMTKYPDGAFCWVDLTANDLAAAERWYSELFGWSFEHMSAPDGSGADYSMFSKDGKVVAGAGQMDDAMKAEGVPPMWNNYVRVSDCAATEARAVELGGKVAMPTMQIMDAGSMCFLQDPTGAHFALWQPDKHEGAQLHYEPGSFAWNELATTDVDAAKRFYAALLGWEYLSQPMPGMEYTTIKVGERDNGGIMPMVGPEMEGMPSHWNTYFSVADTDATARKVRETGGTVHVKPQDIPGVGRFAIVADPQGAVFSLITLTDSPPS